LAVALENLKNNQPEVLAEDYRWHDITFAVLPASHH